MRPGWVRSQWFFRFEAVVFLKLLFYMSIANLQCCDGFSVDSKGTQPYLYMGPFPPPKLPSHPDCQDHMSRASPALYSRSLFIICFKYIVVINRPNSLSL